MTSTTRHRCGEDSFRVKRARTSAYQWPVPLFLSAILFALVMATGCDEEVTLIDPGPFFSYDPDNAWPAPCSGPAGRSATGEAAGEVAAVPPPAGLAITACPNPAPPGTREIVVTFRLDVRRPSVNLAIVNDRGLIVSRLLENYPAEVDREISVSWLLEGVPAGSYRAYFLAGDIESEGDLRVD